MSFKEIVDKKYQERLDLTAPVEPVDALTFVTSHKWLGERPFTSQSLVFKLLYGLWKKYPITKEEQELLDILKTEWGLDLENRDINQFIKVLILVFGRRGSKSSITSWIAAYEVYRLICKGNPQKYYRIRERHPIHLLNCASDGEQAKETFNFIKDNIKRIDFFQQYIDFEKDNETELRLFSPYDLFLNSQIRKYNETRAKGAMKKNILRGSICIESVTTSAATKRGKSIICVSGDTLLLTKKGIVPIESIVESDKKIIIEKEIKLFGSQGESTTSHVMCSGKEKGIKISTKLGFDLIGTKEHKILKMSSEGDIDFGMLNNICVGDWVCIQKGQNYFGDLENLDFEYNYYNTYKKVNKLCCKVCGKEVGQVNAAHLAIHSMTSKQYKKKYPDSSMRTFESLKTFNYYKNVVVPRKMSKELARLLGYLISEGNVTEKTFFSVYNTNIEILNDIEKCIEKCFPNVTYKRKRIKNLTKDCFGIHIASKKVRKFLEFIGVGYKTYYEKEIPWCILQSPKEIIREFVKAYFDGDGCVAIGTNKYQGQLFMSTVSEKLAKQLQFVLLNFGIVASKKANIQGNFLVIINGATDILKYKKEIGVLSSYNTTRLERVIKKIQKTKSCSKKYRVPNLKKKLKNLYNYDLSIAYVMFNNQLGLNDRECIGVTTLKKVLRVYSRYSKTCEYKDLEKIFLFSEKVIWDKVVKKEKTMSCLMYDVTVPKTHNFDSDGFISHNCLIFDEFAHFGRAKYRKHTLEVVESPQTDHAMWTALTPSVKDFGKDGLIVAISSPLEKIGEFYNLYCAAGGKEQNEKEKLLPIPEYLLLQLSTWQANPRFTREDFASDYLKDPVSAAQEYGAHFGEPAASFLNPQKIDDMVVEGAPALLKGRAGQKYIITVDPASKGDTYAIAWGHREDKPAERYWIDGLKGFEPTIKQLGDGKIVIERIDPDIVMDFLLTLITNLSVMGKQVVEICYDHWNSVDSISSLRKKRLPAIETFFSNKYKGIIYGTFLEKVNQGYVKSYEIDPDPAENWVSKMNIELKYLQKIISGKFTYYTAPTSGPVTTDDFADVVANLVYRLAIRKDLTSKVIREIYKQTKVPVPLGKVVSPKKGASLFGLDKKRKNIKDRIRGKKSFENRNWR